MAKFNKTDIVKLISGGPEMMIKDMWTDVRGNTFLQCSWINEAKETVESTFTEDSLEVVTAVKKDASKIVSEVASVAKSVESAVVSEVKSIAAKVESVFEKKQVSQPAAPVTPAASTSAPTVAPVVTPVDVSKK